METLSENLDEPMYTDQRQTLLGLDKEKYLERLICDVMNQTVR